jgi:hypothetical protein
LIRMLKNTKVNKNVMSNMKLEFNPHISNLIKICDYFDVSLDQLVTENLCSFIPKEQYESKFMVREDFKNEKTTRTTS